MEWVSTLGFLKSGKHKVEVVCEKDCPWRMYASFDGKKEAFVVKTVIDDHRCSRAVRNRQADKKLDRGPLLRKISN